MKVKYLLFLVILCTSLVGCSFDMDENPNANIKFTVTTTSENEMFQLGLQSKKIIIDWGDGITETKEGIDGQEFLPYSHTYAEAGKYTVTVSTLNVTGFETYRDYPVTKFTMGDCPSLIRLELNNVRDLTYLRPVNSRNIYSIAIKDCVSLTSLDLTNLPRLAGFSCINTQLATVDISKNTWLRNVNIQDSPFSSISFENNPDLRGVAFVNTEIKTLSFTKNEKTTEVYCIDNKMEFNGLDFMFISLPKVTDDSERVLSIRGNPGTYTCNPAIATTKGWNVK